MILLQPLALALAGLALPILLMYMLRLRRQEIRVSSIYLWQQVIKDRLANTPWQRLRRNLLLLLQLFILAGLVLTLARPARQVPAVTTGSAVILLDASASMQVLEGGQSRFNRAQSAARQLVEELPANTPVTLVLAGVKPQVLVAAERRTEVLVQAIDQATAFPAAADWPAALALATGAQRALPGDATLIILSDGGISESNLPPLSGDVRYLPVGSASSNMSISNLSSRQVNEGWQVFIEVSNYGMEIQSAVLSLRQDDRLIEARRISISPGDHQGQIFDLAGDSAGILQASLGILGPGGERLDPFPLDDAAFLPLGSTQASPVYLVSTGNYFLEQLLGSQSGFPAFRILPDNSGQIILPDQTNGIYVLDSVLPEPLPGGNLLLINPPANPWFEVGTPFNPTLETVIVRDDPRTEFLDWDSVQVGQARSVATPVWARPLVEASSGPLVFTGETGGRKIAVLTFDLLDSDLPLQVAFPILFANLLADLASDPGNLIPDQVDPGQPVEVAPGFEWDQLIVRTPSGSQLMWSSSINPRPVVDTTELGIYRFEFLSSIGTHSESMAVNLFSAEESRIAPRQNLTLGRQEIQPATETSVGLREFWPWVVALALGVLIVEWGVAHEGRLIQLRVIVAGRMQGFPRRKA